MHPVARSSARLTLRETENGDVEGVHAIYGNAEATRHLSFEPRTRDEVCQIVARSVASAAAEPRTEYGLAVVERHTQDLVGVGRLATDPHQQRAATMGFALRPDMWGAGYGLEIVHLLLGVAFLDLGLHRVWGARSPLNAGSARTMAAAGMVEEGVIRGHIQRAGQWRDSVVHGILAEEWEQPA
ncbi:N-acetyltransferase [Streptomyces alfalfae]|uniref:Acetyltransferase n=1 Tax=Streptomyces alfalfae TaxID=1642299 RepID=A0A1P8TCU6_9ACTN|nr:GNAT family protein [Streptomyces alfalfae]AYA15811.1 N-acetyltransferase [Streptomyces fradiae]APY85455.1 acetyltransferase [Streptomyces alfalfae]QQC92789.1 GNAT family N-acetyltransferase [Streptomyces alfalfae]RXX39288.1 N-acetyltransferase [Streptomyces alfalfae]RZM96203.1 N-acetyltransferase [Streptomyces alfalfae]